MLNEVLNEVSVPHTKVHASTGNLLGSLLMSPYTAKTVNLFLRKVTPLSLWFADSELEFVDRHGVDSLVVVEPLLLAELVAEVQNMSSNVGGE